MLPTRSAKLVYPSSRELLLTAPRIDYLLVTIYSMLLAAAESNYKNWLFQRKRHDLFHAPSNINECTKDAFQRCLKTVSTARNSSCSMWITDVPFSISLEIRKIVFLSTCSMCLFDCDDLGKIWGDALYKTTAGSCLFYWFQRVKTLEMILPVLSGQTSNEKLFSKILVFSWGYFHWSLNKSV